MAKKPVKSVKSVKATKPKAKPKPTKRGEKSTPRAKPPRRPFTTPPVVELLTPPPVTDDLRKMSHRAKWVIRKQLRKSSCDLLGHGKVREVAGVGKLCERCNEWLEVYAKPETA